MPVTQPLKTVVPSDIYSTDSTATRALSIQIRVLLSEGDDLHSWVFRSDSGFFLIDPKNQKNCITLDQHVLTVLSKGQNLYINGKRLTRDRAVIKAQQGHILFDGHVYQGSMYVVCRLQKTLLINCLDLEDYVACVLNAEAWPGWPHEMNKVLAIAIRSYAVAMMREAADCKRIYHVKNSVVHQVYSGTHTNQSLHDAVLDTQGIIMTYAHKPIVAMYDACCGSVVTARMRGINFSQAPYLARKSACTHCKTCKIYSWEASFSYQELTKLLKPYIPGASRIKSMTISKRDGAGLVREVTVKTARGYTRISGKKIYGLPRIKSFCYTIESTKDGVLFKGRGYGHHVGLCQWGACQMVHKGIDYKTILNFYYPGITCMRIVR